MSLIRVRDKEGNYIDIPALQGEAAYDIAVRNGFVGTEQEWLESIGGSDKIKIKRREFDMRSVGEDFIDGFALTDVVGTNTIAFYVKENLPNNARIVDFDIEFNGTIYSSSELAINDLISFLDEIQIYPSMRYQSSEAAYLAVTIACNNPTALLYSNIGNEYNLTKLFLYYVDSEVEIIPYE